MKQKILFIAFMLGFCSMLKAQTTETITSSGTWTCPAGVTSVTVECWSGGGGSGGTHANPSAGGGGAGGNYATTTIPVTPGTAYTVTIGSGGTAGSSSGGNGANGGDTWFNTNTAVIATGGVGGTGTAVGAISGAGAIASSTGCIGTTIHIGGNGGNATSGTTSGAGGGSAGATGDGGAASGGTAGAAGTGGGAAGAAGKTSGGAGGAGTAPGSGASGGYRTNGTARAGAAGGKGRIKITYTCPALSIPYAQDFESTVVPALPSCTGIQNVGSGSNWATAASPNNYGFTTSGGQVLQYAYDGTYAANVWWYTQGINLTAGTNYVISYKYGNGSTSFPEKMKVAYGTSAVNTAMTNLLADHPNISSAVATVNSVDFSPPSTGVYYFGFNAYSSPDELNLYLDSIKIDVSTVTCIPIAGNITSTNVLYNAANINFTPLFTPPSNGYDYYVSTTNTAPNASTTPTANVASSPIMLSNLTPNINYYVWVRPNCGGSQGTWSSSYANFTTPCLPTDVPYVQQFESVTVPAIPSCTSVENAGSGNLWATAASPAAYGFTSGDGNLLRYTYNSDNAANAWWYTQGINLTAGTAYYISYKYGNDYTGYTEKMKVAYGTSPGSTAMTNVLATHANISTATAAVNQVYFTPTTSGVYYFGFNCYSATDQEYLYLDSITVDLAPSCIAVSGALTATGVTISTANINFTQPYTVPSGGYDYYVSTTNTAPDASTTPSGNSAVIPIAVSNLNAATAYYVWVRSNCGSSQTTWSNSVNFTTNIANDDASGAITLAVGAGCTGNPYTNVGATVSTGEPYASCAGSAGFSTVWYKFVAPASGAVKVTSDGTGETIGNRKMALFSVTNPNDYSTFNILACDNDNGVLVTNASLFYYFGLTPGTTYYINLGVTANNQTKGTFCLQVDEFSASMLSNTAADCQASQTDGGSAVPSAYHGWTSITDATTGNLIANVRGITNSANQAYTSSVTVKAPDAALRTDDNGLAYMNRNFLITGTNTTSTDVQLFFTNAELAAMGGNIANLNVTKVAGNTCSANYTPLTNVVTALTQTANGSANGVSYIQVNTPGFSNFYIMNGTTPLPLKLISFDGQNKGAVNTLNWKTAEEKNFNHFELQRSTDGINFSKLDIIKGKNIASGSSYDYIDNHPLEGRNFYRLNMVDMNGKSAFSTVVELTAKGGKGLAVNVHPNPVSQILQVAIDGTMDANASIQVVDIVGKVVKTFRPTSNNTTIDMSNLANGTYIVKYSDNSHSFVTKVTKN